MDVAEDVSPKKGGLGEFVKRGLGVLGIREGFKTSSDRKNKEVRKGEGDMQKIMATNLLVNFLF